MHAQQDRPGQAHREPFGEQFEQRPHGDGPDRDGQHLVAGQPVEGRAARAFAARGGDQPHAAVRP